MVRTVLDEIGGSTAPPRTSPGRRPISWSVRASQEGQRMMKAGNERAGEVSAVPILSLNRVHKSFTTAATPAVVDLSFDVAEGEIVSLLGPSGCGKTTTLRCISGLESVTAGEISVAGRVVSSATVHVPPHRRHIGLVFQSYSLWPHMTVDQNVRYGLEMLRVTRHEEI